jgi:hypothetical protein
MTNLKDSAARTEVGPHNVIGVAMEDLPKAERRALEKEFEEEMAEARRRKLACLKKHARVISKTVPVITTTTQSFLTSHRPSLPLPLFSLVTTREESKQRANPCSL